MRSIGRLLNRIRPIERIWLCGGELNDRAATHAANAAKLFHGPWAIMLIATAVFALMTTWHRGRRELAHARERDWLPTTAFMADVRTMHPKRVPGAAVFMTHDPLGAAVVLCIT